MQLINPGALLLLGLVPILILIHSLKPKPKKFEVTNLFLWQEVLDERTGGVFIKRLVNNLPLLLQILAVILASVALAKPVWFYTPKVKGDVILVMDTSASMKTLTGSGTRFDQARKEALGLIADLPGESRMLIIEAGRNPIVLSPFSNDKGLLKQIVEGIQPSDEPGRLEKALFLALSFWHLVLNHLGFRANYLPLTEILCFLFLFRALRTGRLSGYVLSGFFLGLSLHTYTAARLQSLDGGAPVSEYTVARELGHGGHAMIRRVYGHLGQVRHRSEHVEYRVEHFEEKLGDRLAALRQ